MQVNLIYLFYGELTDFQLQRAHFKKQLLRRKGAVLLYFSLVLHFT